MVPVARESKDASKALDHALRLLEMGHCVGVYPEGTLTRDANGWPMVAKTGLARLAIATRTPIVVAVGRNLWESARLELHLYQLRFVHPMAK